MVGALEGSGTWNLSLRPVPVPTYPVSLSLLSSLCCSARMEDGSPKSPAPGTLDSHSVSLGSLLHPWPHGK